MVVYALDETSVSVEFDNHVSWSTVWQPPILEKKILINALIQQFYQESIQSILDQLMPGLLALLLTFLCMRLLKKKVNLILIIFVLFLVDILGYKFRILG